MAPRDGVGAAIRPRRKNSGAQGRWGKVCSGLLGFLPPLPHSQQLCVLQLQAQEPRSCWHLHLQPEPGSGTDCPSAGLYHAVKFPLELIRCCQLLGTSWEPGSGHQRGMGWGGGRAQWGASWGGVLWEEIEDACRSSKWPHEFSLFLCINGYFFLSIDIRAMRSSGLVSYDLPLNSLSSPTVAFRFCD